MKKERKPVRTIMLLIVFAVCVNAAVNHLNVVGGALRQGIGLTAPILLGFVLAFLLSIPVRVLEKHVIRPRGTRWLRGQQKLQRPLSILLSTVLLALIVQDDTREVAGSVISAAFSVFGKMYSMLFALIIAFSAVSQKERLARQCKALLYAAVPEKRADCLLGMGRKITGIFASFMTGQVLEAFILGSMVRVGMMIFRFPNAFASPVR